MDRRERFESPQDALLVALKGWQSDMWTALPGIIQSFDAVAMTCTVQPSLQAQITSPVDGSKSWMNLPLLVDCPVFFPSGGGCTLTFPIVKGDECLVIFASRCIDAWWQSGGIQQQSVLRIHDLSDGFVFAGVRSQVRTLPGVSTTTAQLRSDDGVAFVEINPTSHLINVNTSGNVTMTASGNITATAVNATVNASGVATITSPSIILKNAGAALKNLLNSAFATWVAGHVHSNGNGGANTGAPTTSAPAGSQTSVVQAE